MKPNDTFYDVLGVAKNATRDEIRAVYRRRAKECHPDRYPHANEKSRKFAEMAFRQLTAVYDVLYDPVQRKAYDESIATASLDDVVKGNSAEYDALIKTVETINQKPDIGFAELLSLSGLENNIWFQAFCNTYRRSVDAFFKDSETLREVYNKEGIDWKRIGQNASLGLLMGYMFDPSNPLMPLSGAACAGTLTAADEKITGGASKFSATAYYTVLAAGGGLVFEHLFGAGYETLPYVIGGISAFLAFAFEASKGTKLKKDPDKTLEQREAELYESFRKNIFKFAERYTPHMNLRRSKSQMN